MVLAVNGGDVNTVPVNIGVPPVGVVYHLNEVPGVVEDAVKVAVCPELIFRDGGVTATLGTAAAVIVTDPLALVADGVPVASTTASA